MNRKLKLLQTLKVGVICGGNSSEREVSLKSGRAIYTALQRSGFRVIYIDPADSVRFRQDLKEINLAFLALHGKGGEDGRIQCLLEKKGIAYTGSGPRGSERAFDKARAKRIFYRHGIPTPAYEVLSNRNLKSALKKLSGPLFMKPVSEGSSIGIWECASAGKAAGKIRTAIAKTGSLLAEKKIQGREFTVGILKEKALPVVELKTKNSFYDYHAKYTKGRTSYLVPAPIKDALGKKMQRVALNSHKALGLRDFSRVDIMMDEEESVFVLEVNTIPGFTELSLLPMAARARGKSFDELCCEILMCAVSRMK